MQLTKISTLVCIVSVIQKYGDNYAFATQAKYLELLKEHHGISIGFRMLNYHLADLEKEGLIKRIKRTHREANGKLHLVPTAICITIKGCAMLAKKGVRWAWQQLNKLKKKYLPKDPAKSTVTTATQNTTTSLLPDSLKQKVLEAHHQKVSLYSLLLPHDKKNP